MGSGVRPYEAMFLRLPSRHRGRVHAGDSNCVLTAHLTLDAPPGKRGTLEVAGAAHDVCPGAVLVFDHTNDHCLRTRSGAPTVVLACRFYHAGVTEVERWVLLFLAEILDVLRQSTKWRLA